MFRKYSLLLMVFFTGAASLVIEIVALRILSPYFGNTIFSTSSVIGVVLAALSFGYFFGGQLADKKPSFNLFYSIIFLSGLAVLLIQFCSSLLLPIFGYRLSLINGSLVFSIILFFLPAFLLGMLSPFAIKLLNDCSPKQGIGKISGQIFFVSTLGSIAGSLITGFVLIPNWGVRQIISCTGYFLVILGLVPLISKGLKIKKLLLIFFSLTVLTALGNFTSISQPSSKILYQKDGIYENILIFDSNYKERPTRFLKQDMNSSSAMFLDSNDHVFDYTKYFSLYQISNPEAKQFLVLGGGSYTIPKAILGQIPKAKIDIAEIEPSLYSLAEEYFQLKPEPRLTNYVQDGRRFLSQSPATYDMIFSDVYGSLYSIPTHLTTKEFFQLTFDHLNDQGILIVNLIGDLAPETPSLALSMIKTMKSVFPQLYVFAVDSSQSKTTQNLILAGHKSQLIIDFDHLESNQGKIMEINLSEKLFNWEKLDYKNVSLLTDNYAPIEYLTSKILKRN